MKKILFVCNGNVYRSPVAKIVFKNLLKKIKSKGIKVESAGVSNTYVGKNIRKVLPESILINSAKKGVDLRRHKIRLISNKIIKNFSLIIVFDKYIRNRLIAKYPEFKDKIKLLKELAGYKGNIKNLKGKPLKEHMNYIDAVTEYLEKSMNKIVSD